MRVKTINRISEMFKIQDEQIIQAYFCCKIDIMHEES